MCAFIYIRKKIHGICLAKKKKRRILVMSLIKSVTIYTHSHTCLVWSVGCFVLLRINLFGSFNVEKFQTIQFSIGIFCLHTDVKTVLLQTIQFSISSQVQCQKQSCFKQISLA